MPTEIGQLYGRAGAVELTKEFLSRPRRDGVTRSRQQPILVFTGQLVLRQNLDTVDRARACGQVSQALATYRNVDALRDFLVETAEEVATVLHHGQPVPGAHTAAKYAAKLVLQGLIASRLGRRVLLGKGLDWYGHQDRGLHRNPLDVLVDLNVQGRRPEAGDNGREVSALLWAAFLADLRDDFQTGRHAAGWPLNCVILVDNADAAGDSSFLDELITARRRHAAHSPADPDPLTVLAASRGALSARVTPPGETVPPADQAGYEQYLRWSQEHRLPQWWYPVRLRPLTEDEVGNMVAAIGFHGTDQQLLVPALQAFSSGHLGSVRLVVEAMAAAPPGPVSLPELLARRRGTGQPTLEEELLGQFLPGLGKDTIEDLVTCAAAWDIDRASRLARRAGCSPGRRAAGWRCSRPSCG
jgi:hypothetical protein